jgi:hypothetical protein
MLPPGVGVPQVRSWSMNLGLGRVARHTLSRLLFRVGVGVPQVRSWFMNLGLAFDFFLETSV